MVMTITFVKGEIMRGNSERTGGASSCSTLQFPPSLPNDPRPDNIAAGLVGIEVCSDRGVSFALLRRFNAGPTSTQRLDARCLL
jgi:hypothetical protein